METGRTTKSQFAEVYREFEQLHGQVKKMAQHHPSGQTLEVHNMEVCGYFLCVDIYIYMEVGGFPCAYLGVVSG